MKFKLRFAAHMSTFILGVKYITVDSFESFVLMPFWYLKTEW